MTAKLTALQPIQFGPQYEPEKMRRLSDQAMTLAKAINILQTALAQGASGQLLAKTTNRDFDTAWVNGLISIDSAGTGHSLISSLLHGALSLKSLAAAGSITLTDNGDTITITGSGGSGGAPGTLTYLTLMNEDSNLPNSRQLRIDTSVLAMHDSGAGGALILSVKGNSIGAAQLTNLGSEGVWTKVTVDSSGRVTEGGAVQASDVVGLADFIGNTVRGATFVGGGSAVTLPINDVPIYIPSLSTILGVNIVTEGGVGSCELDLWRSAIGAYPPTIADSICGGNLPAIVGGTTFVDNTLTGWSAVNSPGEVLMIHLNSTSIFELITISVVLKAGLL